MRAAGSGSPQHSAAFAVWKLCALIALFNVAGSISADAQVLSGTYVGNGIDATAITQLGFQPDVVFIKGENAQVGVIKTSTMAGDSAKPMVGALALAANLIQSLDSSGFTIGTDARVNSSGINYHWIAFKAAAGTLKVGSYTGDGGSAHAITGVGFSPELVFIMRSGTADPVFRTSASTSSCDFLNTACSTTGYVTALGADGFTVGTDSHVNTSGQTYYYAAWNQIAGEMKVGTYTGNGADSRNITGVGFAPLWVIGRGIGAFYASHHPASLGITTDLTLGYIAFGTSANVIQQLQADGFQVGNDVNINGSGTTFVYAAWAQVNLTAVKMKSLQATRTRKGTLLEWRTGLEVDNLGFHVYREIQGVRTRMTGSLIGGSALMMKRNAVGDSGHVYRWLDTDTSDPQGASYWIEDVDLNGTRTWHGPITPVEESAQTSAIDDTPKQRTHGRPASDRAKLSNPLPADRSVRDARTPLAVQQALAAQSAVKLAVRAEGWYRVTQPELIDAGLPDNINPRTLQLFVEGHEEPIKVDGEFDNRFDAGDAVEFYGTALDTPYSDARIYWLVAGKQRGLRIPISAAGPTAAAAPVSFLSIVERKDRTVFFAALQNGDAENFFGDVIVPEEPLPLTLDLPHVDSSASEAAALEVVLQGVTELPNATADHVVAVLINGVGVGNVTFDGRAQGKQRFFVPASALYDGTNIVTLIATGGESDVSLVDTIRLTYPRLYQADGGYLRFAADGQQAIRVDGLGGPSAHVFDITDPSNIIEIFGRSSSGSFSAAVPGAGPRAFLGVMEGGYRSPASIELNNPSAWNRSGHAGDYVVLTHRDFLDAIAPLKALRESQGYRVAVVDIDDVYDEFNFGEKTPDAIREFLIRARAAWSVPPRFVTLVGNATTDPRDYLGLGEPDYLPTKIVSTLALETASDDWYGDVDGDGVAELATIGRLPVRTLEQADAMIGKIVDYDFAPVGAWVKSIALVADASEENDVDFAGGSRRLHALVPADYAVTEIFRGEIGTSAARSHLLDALNAGQAVVNYAGHGSVQLWRDDVFTSDDVASLMNGNRTSFFVLMDCLNGFFQSLFPEESLAESLMRAPDGGAVAVWASSAVTGANGQAGLNQALFRMLFDGRGLTLGEAVRAAKTEAAGLDIRKSWIFFGDPATRLKGVDYRRSR